MRSGREMRARRGPEHGLSQTQLKSPLDVRPRGVSFCFVLSPESTLSFLVLNSLCVFYSIGTCGATFVHKVLKL